MAASIDVKHVYTQQIVIPLKLLDFPVDGASKFNYNIRLNGSLRAANMTFEVQSGSSDPTPKQMEITERLTRLLTEHIAMLSATTDFSGEYTLAKKP